MTISNELGRPCRHYKAGDQLEYGDIHWFVLAGCF